MGIIGIISIKIDISRIINPGKSVKKAKINYLKTETGNIPAETLQAGREEGVPAVEPKKGRGDMSKNRK
jgi:hypothetical protein